MTNWRTTPSGVLFAPPRGQAPACPQGFEPVSGNAFMFNPELICEEREQVTKKTGCCTSCILYYCHRDDSFKLYTMCRKCQNDNE